MTMKRLSLGIVYFTSLLITAPLTAANAADLPVKAPPLPPPPILSWNGCYIGINGGGGFGRDKTSTIFPTDAGSVAFYTPAITDGLLPGSYRSDQSGALGGGQVGCNYQVNPNWVLGIEADYDAAHISGSSSINTPGGTFANGTFLPGFFSSGSTINSIGTVRGRLGWTPTDSKWLFYATAGLAYASVRNVYSGAFREPTVCLPVHRPIG
jgi:outer membrane immunogenic protein